jgi:GrpB-like predicted nucleotidyltransferase (UPF0157 family)
MHDPEQARQSLGKVHIVPSDKSWPGIFSLEKKRLRPCLGPIADELQHYGSTAVARLMAKPVIDMMAPVSSLHQADTLDESLANAGYQKIDAGFFKRRFYRRPSKDDRPAFHLHLVVCPAWPIKNELLLRDWLIVHPETAREYEALKLKLATTFAEDMPQYTHGKTSFLRRVVNEARTSHGLPAENDWDE